MEYIYLDNSATTKVLPEIATAMAEVMITEYGNPSSLHGKGVKAERRIRQSREKVAALLGASSAEIFFTSGGTEANNWAILGTVGQKQGQGKHLVTTQTEHPSVLAAFQYLEQEGFRVTYLPVDEEGLVSLGDLEDAMTPETILVSIMQVNNETGTVQPIENFASLVKKIAPRALFHVDGVQALGKIPMDLSKGNIDLLTVSAHKIHGPKGVGALYIKKGVTILPLLIGGEQEGRLRAGTENVPGIVGFGIAAAKASSIWEKSDLAKEMQLTLQAGLEAIPGCYLNGARKKRTSYILNVWFEGVDRGEVLVHMLEEKGLYVSTGSACHSRRDEPSHVLKAMGKEAEALYGAIRLSLSPFNTANETEKAVEIIKEAIVEYRDFKGGL